MRSVTVFHGGELHDDAPVIYGTSDHAEAAGFGTVAPLTFTLERPLVVAHSTGVSWRDRIEQLIDGSSWTSVFDAHDGVIYNWPPSTDWRTGAPRPARRWVIALPGTVTA